jgi:hypothetical protein
MKHYVYKIVDVKTGEFYFGSRTHETPHADKYMGSYKVWKPEDVNRLLKEIIHDDFETRNDAVEFESYLISNHIDDPLNRNYYIPDKGFHTTGLDVCSKDAFIGRYGERDGIIRYNKWLASIKNTMILKINDMSIDERKQKFGNAGELNPNYGNTWSEEWRKLQSERMIEYYKTHKPPRLGKHHTENTKKKLSEVRIEYYKNNSHVNLGSGVSVLQYDIDGNLIKEWDRVVDAAKFYGVGRENIYRCISGKIKTSSGYVWVAKTKK